MKTKVIVNSRISKSLVNNIKDNIKSNVSCYNIEYTEYPHHARNIARTAARKGYDIVLAAGGDGTVNDVINGIAGTDTALSIFPAGTANDLASYYYISKYFNSITDPINDYIHHFPDLINVNGFYYSTCGGLGLPAKVVQTANSFRKTNTLNRLLNYAIGHKLYTFSLISSIINKNSCNNKIFICENNRSFEINALSFTINNQPFLGSDILMSPGALNDDGLFDVCLIEGQNSRIKVLDLLQKIKAGKHVSMPEVWSWKAEEICLRTGCESLYFGDGDILCKGNEFNIKLIKNALNVLVPNNFYVNRSKDYVKILEFLNNVKQ